MAERVKVGVLISGRGSNMKALIEAADAADCPYEIALVVSNDPAAAGLDYARGRGIPTWAKSHKGMDRAAFDQLVDAELRRYGIARIALAGYMRLLSPAFIAAWSGRILNIHPSLLPRHKGLDTHARAISAGDTVHGCSVHVVTVELDDGPVVAQAEVPVLAGDTAEILAERVLAKEHRLYPEALARWVRQ